MTFTILHNKNCSKSRLVQILEKNKDFTIREYVKDSLSIDEVKHLVKIFGE